MEFVCSNSCGKRVRSRPQRILLGNWPDEHVRQVIRAVVFRDGTIPSYNHAANFAPPASSSGGPPLSNGQAASSSPRPPSTLTTSSPPRAPPPTPMGQQRSVSPQQPVNKFLDNSLFAAHLKTLSEHFTKNGVTGNGILDSLPFKAFMSEAMHHPTLRKSMDFEDAEEPVSGGLRRSSLTPPTSLNLDRVGIQ